MKREFKRNKIERRHKFYALLLVLWQAFLVAILFLVIVGSINF